MVLALPPSEDGFTLAAMSLGLNSLLMALQLFKHLTLMRAANAVEEPETGRLL